MSLQNKVALVTGAASGIGEQCARKLASLGAAVVIADLNVENAQKVADSIVAAGGNGGSIIYMGSVHSHEASKLKSAYVTAKHGLLGLARVVAKEGGPRGVHANVVCPGYVRTPLVDKQIPEQAAALGISEQDVVKNVMLKETVDGEFTTVEDVANTVAFLAGFESNALTGQSIIVSHGWAMQ
jgi:3-hydroxybutyrate dehydrogenase